MPVLILLREGKDYIPLIFLNIDFLLYQLSRFHPCNVLGIRTFADQLSCSHLVEEADKYIQQYFHDVSLSDEYLSLLKNELLDIVRRDELHIISEEQVNKYISIK